MKTHAKKAHTEMVIVTDLSVDDPTGVSSALSDPSSSTSGASHKKGMGARTKETKEQSIVDKGDKGDKGALPLVVVLSNGKAGVTGVNGVNGVGSHHSSRYHVPDCSLRNLPTPSPTSIAVDDA